MRQSIFKGSVSCFQVRINCFHANFTDTMDWVLKTSFCFLKKKSCLHKPKLNVFAFASMKRGEFFVPCFSDFGLEGFCW